VIENDFVLARDVAAAIPAFAPVPGDFNLGLIPLSGAPRIFRGADLQRIAKNRGVDLEQLPDVCFERRTFVPTAEQIRGAMSTALNIAGAKIEISSWSRQPAPAGEVIFPLEGLRYAELQKEQLWNGHVRYGGDRQFPVWARVRITAATTRVVTLTNLPAGKPIHENQVRLESCEDFPLDATVARRLDEVVGYAPKASLRAMTAIRKTQLERAPEVHKGDLVRVQVVAGAARLELEGRAQSEGAEGSTILVRNPASGKDFRARVTGKDRVIVQ
jgi:flagella basal body P-ring formation protein FlgA